MADKEKFLGEFEQVVLLACLHLGKEAYGASLRQLLQQEIQRDVAIGALYSTLERLEKKGMVTSHFGEATAERGGKPKRFFEVTAKGQQSLKRAREAMDTLWQGISIRTYSR
ncbi:PadR family transcriptional regulator [Planctobacterium marinum]|uniref:PadR family transcriptional regulator n=1 Tax=Planctobacterium marinum TaxID=1631968 RepID=UPI001E37EF35|nr:helix-turn-helix transcriptional regulator [Planctobacterium marinum]MCC2606391.1 PadR family transcriptional regulator [Planctobacterium marinum]